jgi:hypothetical protein
VSFNFEIPMRVGALYHSILIHAAACNSDAETIDKKKELLKKLCGILDRLVAKHLSDSPGKSDKKKLAIEVFETALKIAKGEIKI